ncbi:MAG: acyl-CoA thioesterase [Bacteroidales bacterium]|nr:acyl-CoA thioesterase [Bacteroidales bacterium]
MIIAKSKIRVRYGEVDQMGYLHHGNYALYLEEARTTLLRELGLSYKKMEEEGILLPVKEMEIRYILPVVYDEEVTVKTMLINIPGARLDFKYEILNSENEIVCKAITTLVFIEAATRRPIRAPGYLIEKIQENF